MLAINAASILLILCGDVVSGFSRTDFAPTSSDDNGGVKQCSTPGSCDDNSRQVIEDDADSGDSGDNMDNIEEEVLPDGFEDYLNSLEVYEVHEMHQALVDMNIAENGGITTMMQRHVERILISHQFPGMKSPQDPDSPTFATFGSMLDVSTVYSASWGGSTEFGGKVSWLGSLFYREAILEHEGRVPCRTGEIKLVACVAVCFSISYIPHIDIINLLPLDLTNDYDDTIDDTNNCILGATIEDYVSIRGTTDKKEEHMELAAAWDIYDEGQWRAGTILELDFGNQKFDTILGNGMFAAPEHMLQDMSSLVLEKLVSLLKPGGVIFFVGIEPMAKVDGPGTIYHEILDVIDSVKGVSAYPIFCCSRYFLLCHALSKVLTSICFQICTLSSFRENFQHIICQQPG